MQKSQMYKNVNHILSDMPFLNKVLENGLQLPEDLIQIIVQIPQNYISLQNNKSTLQLVQDKSSPSLNRIILKPALKNEIPYIEIPIYNKKFMKDEQLIQFQIDKLQPKLRDFSDDPKNIQDFFTLALMVESLQNQTLFQSSLKSQIKISMIDQQFTFINTDKLKEVCSKASSKIQQGLLGFDENHRLIVYGSDSPYPVVGIWSTGIEIGNIFLKNQLNDKIKQLLWVMMMRFACSDSFTKVSFSSRKLKFLYLPFCQKGGVPTIFLVEMGGLLDKIKTEIIQIGPQQSIQESLPIQQEQQKKKQESQYKKQSNCQLWEMFLNKDSNHTSLETAKVDKFKQIEEKLDALRQDFQEIQDFLLSDCSTEFQDNSQKQIDYYHQNNDNSHKQLDQYNYNECIKTESDIQNSNNPHQFQRLLLEQSSKCIFTARSAQSNQKSNNVRGKQDSAIISNRSSNSMQNKFSSFKKLKNSIYDTLEQNNKWLSTERKNLSVEQLNHHEVSSFYNDLPQIITSS